MTSLTEEKLPPCWKCGNVVKFCEGSTFVYECSLCQILVGWGATRQEALNDLLGAFVWKQLSERESVIAKLRAEVKEANIGEFDAMLRENDFKERFYAECKETEALKAELDKTRHALYETSRTTILRLEEQVGTLKSKLGEAEKAIERRIIECCEPDGSPDEKFSYCDKCKRDFKFLSSLRTPSDGEGKS